MHNGELWQEYDRTGTPMGDGSTREEFDVPLEATGERRICGAVHVWLFRDTKNGRELLFQKRSLSVTHNPGLWDISAAGHINVGESNLDACVREAREEIGIDISPESLCFAFSNFAPNHRVFHSVYLCSVDPDSSFSFSDGEVDDVKWVPLADAPAFVRSKVKTPLSTISWYWELLFLNLETL